MADFFAGASQALGLWVLGVMALGAALVYGVFRAGWLKPRERAALDRNTQARQRSEDPKKTIDQPGEGAGIDYRPHRTHRAVHGASISKRKTSTRSSLL